MAYRTTSWKNTDIGKIPSDWDLNLFKNTFIKYPTNSFTRDEMNDFGGSFQNIHYGDILTKYGAILDFNKYTVPYLNSFISKTYKTVQNGDIIIADTAEDETVGKCVEIYDLPQNIKVLSGMHTMFCRPTNYFYPRFLGYYMNSRVYHNQLLPYITGTKVSAVSKTDIDKTYILAPSIPEQQKIAEVLTDIDDLIVELERVRNKKIAIKTGVMQELLTGKRRMLGFNKPWKEVSIEELVNNKKIYLKKGQTLTSQDVKPGNIPVIAGGTSSPYTHCDYNQDKPCVTVSASGCSAGYVWYHQENIWASDCNVLYGTNDYNTAFLAQVLILNQNKIYEMQIGGAQPHVYAVDLKRLIVPNISIEEQTAIANILADIDDEISAISDKISKYKQIKSGVAGELLSGRIRLVKPQE